MARRKFTREFKVSAEKLVNEQGYSPFEAAKRLGVDPASVREWVKKFSEEDGLVPSGEGAVQAELPGGGPAAGDDGACQAFRPPVDDEEIQPGGYCRFGQSPGYSTEAE